MSDVKEVTGKRELAEDIKNEAETEQQLLERLQVLKNARDSAAIKKLEKFLKDEGIELSIVPDITINGQRPFIMISAK